MLCSRMAAVFSSQHILGKLMAMHFSRGSKPRLQTKGSKLRLPPHSPAIGTHPWPIHCSRISHPLMGFSTGGPGACSADCRRICGRRCTIQIVGRLMWIRLSPPLPTSRTKLQRTPGQVLILCVRAPFRCSAASINKCSCSGLSVAIQRH